MQKGVVLFTFSRGQIFRKWHSVPLDQNILLIWGYTKTLTQYGTVMTGPKLQKIFPFPTQTDIMQKSPFYLNCLICTFQDTDTKWFITTLMHSKRTFPSVRRKRLREVLSEEGNVYTSNWLNFHPWCQYNFPIWFQSHNIWICCIQFTMLAISF